MCGGVVQHHALSDTKIPCHERGSQSFCIQGLHPVTVESITHIPLSAYLHIILMCIIQFKVLDIGIS